MFHVSPAHFYLTSMRKNVLLFLGYLLLSIWQPMQAQRVGKGIYFVHEHSKIPVPAVTVRVPSLEIQVVTDESGFLNLDQLPAATKLIQISSIGYLAKWVNLDSVSFAESVTVIGLFPKITSLDEVSIYATAGKGIFKTISDLDIHLRPIINSQEVLRMVPGLFIGQHAGGGKAEQLFLRGFDLDHGTDIQISVDGMPVNMVSHAHGQGYADLHFVIPELIQEVNFDKGPYFANKGNFTTAGFVEFKTKDYLDNHFLKLESGQFGTLRAIGAVNLIKPQQERRTQSLYVAGEGSFTNGYFESPQRFNRFNGMVKYHGKLNSRHTLSALASGFTSRWNASGQIPERAVESGQIGFFGAIDDTEGGNTARYNVQMELATRLNKGGSLHNQLFYSAYQFELYSNFTFFKEDPVNGDQIRQKERRNIWGYNGQYRKDSYWGSVRTETNLGVQLRFDAIDQVELTRTKNRSENINPLMLGDVDEMNAGVYGEERFYFNRQWSLTAGLRADYFTNRYQDQLTNQNLKSTSAIVSPKLRLNYRIQEGAQLYFYAGRGFHSNDTRVAVQENGRKVLPPAYGMDLGGLFKVNKKFFLQTALWYLWLDQEFVYVGDEGVVEAGGQTRRLGLDVSARYQLSKNLYADLDVSLANPIALGVPKAERYLPLAPRFTSVGGLTYRKEKGWNGSLRYRFMGNRPANEDNSVVAMGYFVVDAALNYTTRKWETGISIQNLLNSRWKETQFDTESRLQNEPAPISEIHFTPGTPFFARVFITRYF